MQWVKASNSPVNEEESSDTDKGPSATIKDQLHSKHASVDISSTSPADQEVHMEKMKEQSDDSKALRSMEPTTAQVRPPMIVPKGQSFALQNLDPSAARLLKLASELNDTFDSVMTSFHPENLGYQGRPRMSRRKEDLARQLLLHFVPAIAELNANVAMQTISTVESLWS